jgi:hypothetical protein
MTIVTRSTRMPHPSERLDRYLDALKGNFNPHDHAARASRGLRLMERFRSDPPSFEDEQYVKESGYAALDQGE